MNAAHAQTAANRNGFRKIERSLRGTVLNRSEAEAITQRNDPTPTNPLVNKYSRKSLWA